MALASDHRRPTLGDARRAADALREALDPGVVLLFGSVACGRQQAGSDLDFVLVFDDLGDYAQRRELAVRAAEAVAKATGIASDVRVTDRPEWEVRTKRCRSTFEAHIVAHAVTLASRPPSSPINWQKEIGTAPTDEQQSADSLDNTTHALNSLLPLLEPSGHESDALSAGDFEYAEDLERSRMLNVCAYSQVVMETSLKALIHALKGPPPIPTASAASSTPPPPSSLHTTWCRSKPVWARSAPRTPRCGARPAPIPPTRASKETRKPPPPNSPSTWPKQPPRRPAPAFPLSPGNSATSPPKPNKH